MVRRAEYDQPGVGLSTVFAQPGIKVLSWAEISPEVGNFAM